MQGLPGISGTTWRCRTDLADEIPRVAKRVGEIWGLHDAAEPRTQLSECAIDVAIMLTMELLQKVLPRSWRDADQRLHLFCDLVLCHWLHTGRRIPKLERRRELESNCTHWSPQGIVQSNPIFETVAGGSLLAIIGSTVIVFIDGMITVSRIGSNLKAIADLIWLSSQM